MFQLGSKRRFVGQILKNYAERNLSILNSMMEAQGMKMKRFLRNDTVPTRDISFVRGVN